jgi:cytochrome c-type biogenesis protein CcmH/NrfG
MDKRIDFFKWLGLSAEASADEVDEHCQELQSWLRGRDIPAPLRPWAREQAALAEELCESFRGPQGAGEDDMPTLSVTEHKAGWGQHLKSPVGLTVLGILAGVVILAGIAWGQGRIGGGQDVTQAPSAAEVENQTMAEVLAQIARLEAVIADEPGNTNALFTLGEINIQSGRWEQAISWFGHFMEIEPDNAHALTDTGISHKELGNYSKAESILLKALEVDTSYTEAHYVLGFLYTVGPAANPEAAKEHWQWVVDLEPGTERSQIAQVHLDQLEEESASR